MGVVRVGSKPHEPRGLHYPHHSNADQVNQQKYHVALLYEIIIIAIVVVVVVEQMRCK